MRNLKTTALGIVLAASSCHSSRGLSDETKEACPVEGEDLLFKSYGNTCERAMKLVNSGNPTKEEIAKAIDEMKTKYSNLKPCLDTDEKFSFGDAEPVNLSQMVDVYHARILEMLSDKNETHSSIGH